MIGITPGYALANVDSVDIDVRGVGGHGAYPQTTKDPIVLASRDRHRPADPGQPRERPAQPAVVTVGSFHAGTKHNIISDEAKLAADGAQLHARDPQAAARRHRPDRTRRGDRGRHARRQDADGRDRASRRATSTFNTQRLSNRLLGAVRRAFRRRTGSSQTKPIMAGEDFSRFWLADKIKQSADLLGRRRAPGKVGCGNGRHVETAVAAQPASGRPMRKR